MVYSAEDKICPNLRHAVTDMYMRQSLLWTGRAGTVAFRRWRGLGDEVLPPSLTIRGPVSKQTLIEDITK